MKPRRIKIASNDTTLDDEVEVATAHRQTRAAHPRFAAPAALRHPASLLGMTLVAVYLLLTVFVNAVVHTEEVLTWVASRASAALNRPVTVGDAAVWLLPRPSIRLDDVRVDNLASFDGPALASVGEARLEIAWLPLLLGRIEVRGVVLDGPRVYLGIAEDGTANFGDLVPAQDGATATLDAPIDLDITRVVVSGASISYFDAQHARSFSVSGADARVRVSKDGDASWVADVDTDADSLHVRAADLSEEILRTAGPGVTFTARSDGPHAIEIEYGSVSLAGETLRWGGRLAGLGGPKPSYDLQFGNEAMDAGVLVAALPSRLRAERLPHFDGQIGVALQVSGADAPGERPLLRGVVRFDRVQVHLDGQVVIEEIDGVVGITPESVVLDSLSGIFADGPFELSGTVDRASRIVALRVTGAPDLDALDRLGLVPHGATLSGDAEVDLSIVGRLGALDSIGVAGAIRVTGLQAKHARLGVPIYVPAGELSLVGREVSWSELTMLLGQDEVTVSGRMTHEGPTPQLDVSVQGQRVNLGALLPQRAGAPALTYPQVAFAHLGGYQIDGRVAQTVTGELGLSRPRSLPVRGTLSLDLDTLDFRGYRLEAMSARIEFSDTTLLVETPSFTIWGGTGSGSLRMDIGSEQGEAFALALSIDGTDGGEFLAVMTPAGRSISGALDLELDVQGALDWALLPSGQDLTGRARLSMADGRVHHTGPNLVIADFLASDEWSDVPFDRWKMEVELTNRRLEVITSELTSPLGQVAFDGMLILDGSHDLSLGLSIPSNRLGTVSLRRTGIGQSVLDHLASAGSSLDLGLRMSGLLSAPQLEPDASNAVALAR